MPLYQMPIFSSLVYYFIYRNIVNLVPWPSEILLPKTSKTVVFIISYYYSTKLLILKKLRFKMKKF